ncbi:MAG: hypothetical protein ACLUE6_03435 [Acutalibacteraceae bacterium]
MTVSGLMDLLNAKAVHLADGDREISTGYCGDFLSFVMGKAPADCAWFTVMSNLNVCAVASLTDCAVVVLCEGVNPDEALVEKVKQQDVNLLTTDFDVYNAALKTNGRF